MGTSLYFGQLPAVRYLLICIYPSRFVHGSQRLLMPLPNHHMSRATQQQHVCRSQHEMSEQ